MAYIKEVTDGLPFFVVIITSNKFEIMNIYFSDL